MKITGDETSMISSTGHHARAMDERTPYGPWRVSWLTDRTVSYNQATTALVLAQFVTAGVTGPGHRYWAHVVGWAAELGLTAAEAVDAVRGEGSCAPGSPT